MTYDFRASQIRTNKLITSGSTETNAALLIYPFASALNQSGSINPSTFGTGSIGQDVFLFVSGAASSMDTTTQGATVFGGDVKVSGSFKVLTSFTATNTASFSGPVTASNTSLFSGASTFSGIASFSNTASLSGPVTASNTVLFSGAVTVTSTATFSGISTFSNTASFSGPVTASNSLVVTGKLSGSLQTLSDGTPFLVPGPNITITTQSNGAVAISGSAGSSEVMQSWLDYQQKTFAAYPSEAGGDYTIGTRFLTTTSGSTVTGYRLIWNGTINTTLNVKVWSGSVAVASASVVVSAAAPGEKTGSLNTNVSLEPYGEYYISFRDASGANYYSYASGSPFYGFSGTGTIKSARVHSRLLVNYFYCYSVGDAAPSTAGTDTYSSAIEPVITFS